jgi:hypothetical protein
MRAAARKLRGEDGLLMAQKDELLVAERENLILSAREARSRRTHRADPSADKIQHDNATKMNLLRTVAASAAAGLCIPLLLLGALKIADFNLWAVSPNVAVFFWPTSMLLMLTETRHGLEALYVVLISIASNVLFYALVGVVISLVNKALLLVHTRDQRASPP